MTDLCPATEKRKLSPEEARTQAKHSVRPVNAHRCQRCGKYHVSSSGGFVNRDLRRRKAEMRTKRAEPMESDE